MNILEDHVAGVALLLGDTIDLERKIELLEMYFSSRRSKDFDGETFRGLARLRGLECRAAERYAEAFVARKLCVALQTSR